MHISKMIKELGKDDKKFENPAAAIRHYVHLGIAAETATSDLRNSLDNTIVKQSQKEAVRNELKPLSEIIEKLINTIKESKEENSQFFTDVAKRTEIIETKIERANENIAAAIEQGNNSILEMMKSVLLTGEQTLRNLIVLRSIIYVFALGHKTGKIEPGKENLIKWNNLIALAHHRANQLSIAEVKMLSSEVLEAHIIQEMASDIFRQINSLPQPEFEQ